MKKRIYVLPPRLTLALSILFLLASLYLFWANGQFNMPTADLALRKSAAELALPYEDVVSYPVFFENEDGTQSDFGRCYLARRGDFFYFAQPSRIANAPLWSSRLYSLWPYQVWPLRSLPVYELKDHDFTRVADREAMLVTTPDPAVARITLTRYTVPMDKDVPQEELIANYSDTQDCVETAPGSGFWLCNLTVPVYPGSTGWSYKTIVHAYAADGTLISSIPDP